ncbi:MAG TPA: ABC transporter permease subunit [Candidatus Sulfotelmatobacter sp.]|jgi:ABC-type transport system involved in multi-copper enzyme maturation permease subunit|nr:ABC transporter permease subunit [Candidatus Sulfotelmatobacter sp.]
MKNIFAVAGVVIKELYRRKDFYVLFIVTVLICLVMASVNVFNDAKVARYLKEICLLLVWMSSLVIAVTTTARQIPAEKENRTLLPLLAKPISRPELIFGKFFGCWFACGLTLLVFYVFFGMLSATKEHEWPLLDYLQAAVMHWFLLGIIVAMSLLGSLVFAAPSSNSTICFVIIGGILFVGRHLDQVAASMHEPLRTVVNTLYYIVPHMEFYDLRDLIIHNWPVLEWKYILLALLYAAAYMLVFLTGACLVFRRKAVN